MAPFLYRLSILLLYENDTKIVLDFKEIKFYL